MKVSVSENARPREQDAGRAIRRILVVDDSPAQRLLLIRMLGREGFGVRDAGSGEEALALCRDEEFDLVLSDWMMPGMSGLDLCRAFRALPRSNYGYFILLTSKTEKGSVAMGLNVGADDFLTKPVSAEELRARINAGDRVLRMERELTEKNRLVSATLAELQTIYDSLDRDLVDARKMQLALVRENHAEFGSADLSLMLRPSGHVGGDLVGFFRVGPGRVAVYSIDVSGHGVASALLTARLSSYLSDGAPAQNIALQSTAGGHYLGRAPAEVATRLNRMMSEDRGTDLYFTILFGYLDLNSGRFDFVQCGHPNPAMVDAVDDVRFFGAGGLPVGLIDEAEYVDQSIDMKPGDRLILYSDGFTECASASGRLLNESGFETLIRRNIDLEPDDFFSALVWELDTFSGERDFADDLSMALLRYTGPVEDSA